MHDDVDVAGHRLQQRGVADVAFDQPPERVVPVLGDVGQLEGPVVERIEVVDHRDADAIAEQRVYQVAPDEPGSPGDQHVGHSSDITMASVDI